MLTSIVFANEFWSALGYIPIALAFLAGAILWSGLFGLRGWEPRCRRCRHDLRKSIDADVCAECGADLRRRGAVQAGRPRVRPMRMLAGILIAAAGVVLIIPSLQVASRARRALANRLSVAEIAEGSKDARQGWFARTLLSDRVNTGDEETKRATVAEVVDAVVESLASGTPAPNLVWEVLRDASNNDGVTAEQQATIADAVIESMRAGNAAILKSPEVVQLVMSNRELYGERLVACPECLVATITLSTATPAPIPNGDVAVSAAYDMSLSSILGFQARLAIDRVLVKREGSSDWAEAELEVDPFPDMARGSSTMRTIKGSAFQAPGSYAIRAEGTLRLPGATLKPTAVARETTVTILDPATIVLTPLQGLDAKAALEQVLHAIRFRPQRVGSGMTLSMARRPSAAAGPRDDVRIIAEVSVAQGDRRWQVGRLMVSPAGRSRFDGAAITETTVFDEAKPFELRFEAVPRDRIPESGEPYSYVASTFTLRYDNIDDLDPEVVWHEDGAADRP